ncbi:DUF7266 family protein [Halobaculum sp. D14]|uniref:DUF7266 family protein n=1 Tax=unclassified Halobaculum TaxID=2640896 RepID=UPI003EBA7B85
MRDRRAVTPAVAKTLELGVVLLFIGAVSASLVGGVAPEYRAAAGDEAAGRVVAAAATHVEAAVPVPVDASAVSVERRVDLPPTIAGAAYRVVADGGRLTLSHPNPGVAASTPLALPDRVVVDGTWESGAETVVTVESSANRLRVRLVSR